MVFLFFIEKAQMIGKSIKSWLIIKGVDERLNNNNQLNTIWLILLVYR